MDEAERDRLREYIKNKQVKAEEITPERQAEVERLIAGYAAQIKIIQTGPNDFIVTARDVETGLGLGVAGADRGTIFAGKLTKGIVMALPEDCFLMSNALQNDGEACLAERAGDLSKRDKLWKRLRSMKLTNRLFYIFATEDAMNVTLKRHREVYLSAKRSRSASTEAL